MMPIPPWSVNQVAFLVAVIVAAWDLGFGAGGVRSVIHVSPQSGYTKVTASWTSRPTPAARAALARTRLPSARIRSSCRHAQGLIASAAEGMWVARLTTASCPASALLMASGSNRLPGTARAPARSSRVRAASERASAVTSCPA